MKRIALATALFVVGCEGLIGGDPTPGAGGGSAQGGAAGGGDGTAGSGGVGGSGEAGGVGSGGGVATGGSGGAGGGTFGSTDGGVLTTAEVFARLRPTCAGCHTVTARPYFESLSSFETLLVYDTRWVVPGDPTTSALLRLLDGSAGAMPPAPSQPFAQLDAAGMTQVSMADLRRWIASLQPRVAPVDNSHVRRKSADQILRSLRTQLGLVDADLYTDYRGANALPPTYFVKYPKDADGYAVRSPDLLPPNAGEAIALTALYSALGGPSYLDATNRSEAITPSFALVLTHLSQAWCRTAVQKPANSAIFTQASLADVSTTTTGRQRIKDNIADMYFKMLGEVPVQAEVDDLFAVFVAYESKGAQTAWTGVCAALIRDPLWLFY